MSQWEHGDVFFNSYLFSYCKNKGQGHLLKVRTGEEVLGIRRDRNGVKGSSDGDRMERSKLLAGSLMVLQLTEMVFPSFKNLCVCLVCLVSFVPLPFKDVWKKRLKSLFLFVPWRP